MRISDWSSDVCSSDLLVGEAQHAERNGDPAHEGRIELADEDHARSLAISSPLSQRACWTTAVRGSRRASKSLGAAPHHEELSLCHQRSSSDRKSTRLNSSH